MSQWFEASCGKINCSKRQKLLLLSSWIRKSCLKILSFKITLFTNGIYIQRYDYFVLCSEGVLKHQFKNIFFVFPAPSDQVLERSLVSLIFTGFLILHRTRLQHRKTFVFIEHLPTDTAAMQRYQNMRASRWHEDETWRGSIGDIPIINHCSSITVN